MIIRHPSAILLLIPVAIASFASAACQRVPLLAPTGSTITLTSTATVLPVNGTTDIIAQVIQPSGNPPHSGTHITFTTTLGSVQPSDAQTDVSGRVIVKFVAPGGSGTATIQAISGGVSAGANAVKILIGTAGVGRVVVSANPTLVPALGGQSIITAAILDINGNPLVSAPVSFSTNAGTLSDAVVVTDQTGVARTTLQTSTTATVTASVGATGGSSTGTPPTTTPTAPAAPTSGQASGSVTVGVLSSPGLVITPPTTPPGAGLPASFGFVVTPATTNGSFVRNVRVDWGDGSSQDLGAITGTQTVTHVFTTPRTYAITATLTDSSGNTVSVSTSVTVIPVPRPTINIQATPGAVGTFSASFTITITSAAGIGIQDVTMLFGDGTAQDFGGASSGTITGITHTYPAPGGRFNVTVNVTDTTGQVTAATVVVIVS